MLEWLPMPSSPSNSQNPLRALRTRWLLLLLLSGLLLAGGYFFFLQVWSPQNAVWWVFLSGLGLVYQLAQLWRDLNLNHHPGEQRLLPRFGLGTKVSFVRLLTISFLLGFLGQPMPHGSFAWIPLLLYLAANMSDFLDGYLARITNYVTRLGQKLDTDLDGRGLLVVTFLAFSYGKVPWWFLPVGLARYLFIFGLWWRKRQGKAIYDMQPNMGRRAFAGVQMGFSTAMLTPLFSPPETYLAATLFMLPFLSNFLADWGQVSGRSALYNSWEAFLKTLRGITSTWGALLTRVAAAIFLLLRLLAGSPSASYSIIEGLAIIALALGSLGRFTAAIILIETGFRQQFGALGLLDWLILTSCSALLFWGTGSFSLWQPEDNWVQRPAGERKTK